MDFLRKNYTEEELGMIVQIMRNEWKIEREFRRGKKIKFWCTSLNNIRFVHGE